ncbi:MAG: hypothetical protein ACUVV1_05015 [Fimbriimonadales bacterium]
MRWGYRRACGQRRTQYHHARSDSDAHALRAMGVDEVINPFELAFDSIRKLTRQE